MAEHINNQALLGSGGHTWLWGGADVTRKVVGSAGITGAFHLRTAVGARPVRIVGAKAGGPAVLKATAATKALADVAIRALENALELLKAKGTECPWQDDTGRSGSRLVIVDYSRAGPRQYGAGGSGVIVWQFYTLDAVELNGGFSV